MGDLCDPFGVGMRGVCLSAGGSPRGSTTLRLLLRETPLGSFFFNLAVAQTHEPCVPAMCFVVDRGWDSYFVVYFIVYL